MTELRSSETTEDADDIVEVGSSTARAEFAKLDLGIMGLPIFRALPRRGREKARKRMFEIDTVHDGRKLRVVGAYTLGADDLSVLLAVLGLAGLDGKAIQAKNSKAARAEILDGLESEGDVVEAIHMRLKTTLYSLCREAGIPVNGAAYNRVSESLRRIRAVHYDDMGPVGGNHSRLYSSGKQNLLSAARAREDTGEIEVVINARFASFVLGEQWGNMDLRESRKLGEMARILHQRLSVMLRPGNSMRVGIDRMVSWVYGDEKGIMRNQRREVREGIKEITQLPGWNIEENQKRTIVTFSRVRADDTFKTTAKTA